MHVDYAVCKEGPCTLNFTSDDAPTHSTFRSVEVRNLTDMELDLLLPTFVVEFDVMAAFAPWALSAGEPPLWQLAAFWGAASLAVYGSQRLAEYVALSVDHASRKVFELSLIHI